MLFNYQRRIQNGFYAKVTEVLYEMRTKCRGDVILLSFNRGHGIGVMGVTSSLFSV